MEFEKKSVKGEWRTNFKNGMDFFIINDAIVQKLCILGDDVEPCFEGASVTSPNVSTNFTLDDNFRHTLYSMMQDLKEVLNKGGQQMETVETNFVEQPVEENIVDNAVQEVPAESVVSYKKEDDEKKEESKPEEKDDKNSPPSKEKDEEGNGDDSEKDEKKKESAKKYEVLESELNTLKEAYSLLKTQYQALVDFKTKIDNEKKRALIGEFYMLSEEDKQDVLENIEKYSLDDIKAKLSVICFDKKINFALDKDAQNEQPGVTYSLTDDNDNLPDWVKAVKEQEKNC